MYSCFLKISYPANLQEEIQNYEKYPYWRKKFICWFRFIVCLFKSSGKCQSLFGRMLIIIWHINWERPLFELQFLCAFIDIFPLVSSPHKHCLYTLSYILITYLNFKMQIILGSILCSLIYLDLLLGDLIQAHIFKCNSWTHDSRIYTITLKLQLILWYLHPSELSAFLYVYLIDRMNKSPSFLWVAPVFSHTVTANNTQLLNCISWFVK